MNADKMLLCIVAADVEHNVVIPITTDKGLCGGINTTVCKYARATLSIDDADGVFLYSNNISVYMHIAYSRMI